jgi:peptide deformylase
MVYPIQNVNNKNEVKVLRSKAEHFDFEKINKKEVAELVKNMRDTMRKANGVGLAANQVGLNFNVFVAEVPSSDGGSKFYAVFNPVLEKYGDETAVMEEGCLSVPGIFGEVERSERVILNYEDKNGKPQKIKAWGLLARVFQHEVDHLNGKLIIDRAKKIIKEDESK